MSNLPKMYAKSPRVQVEDCGHTFQAMYECPCYSYYVISVNTNSLNANTSVFTDICMSERFDYGYAVSNAVGKILTIHRQVLRTLQKHQ